eukprot:3281296-Prymnesium_polylepis.1
MSDATEEATHGQLVLSEFSYQQLLLEPDVAPRLKGKELESKQYLLEKIEEATRLPTLAQVSKRLSAEAQAGIARASTRTIDSPRAGGGAKGGVQTAT